MKLVIGLGNFGSRGLPLRALWSLSMKLVIGLGNPGPQYANTRHNVGFRIVDKLAKKLGWTWSEKHNRAILASGTIGTEKVVLAKCLTYMNLSGEAVAGLVRWYKLQPKDILVVYDELDLPVGKVRLRAGGSGGGHHGLEDIIHHLHTNQFPRLRIGIGRPPRNYKSGIDYVLGIPSGDERIQLEIGEDRAVEAIPILITQGLDAAMNVVNTDPEAEQRAAEKRQRQKERQEEARRRREAQEQEQEHQAAQEDDS
jgi:peptidyl-tRNA hydrolase, PTH1 family